MADRQRVYEGRPGLSEWGEDLGELNPRVLRAARAGVKANVMPESPSGVPFAGLVESTKSLPALPYFLGDLITGGRYGLSESAPQFAVEASSKYDELLNKYLAEEGLSESERLPILEKYGLAAGEMLGQLPVPGKMLERMTKTLERMTKTLPKAFKPAGWLAEYFGPTVDPKAVNYAIGTGMGGTLRTATGEESEIEPGNIDLAKRPVVRNPDGSVSTVSSIGIEMDGRHFVIPTIVNGQRVTPEQAIDYFKKTRQHLGAFSNREAADEFAQRLHEREAERVGYAKGGLGRKPIIKRTAEGTVETAPAAATEIRKEPGGNWLPGSVERIISDRKFGEIAPYPADEVRGNLKASSAAVDSWLETKLANYIKNDMATERDPVRKGIEQRVAKADESYARGKERIAKNQKKIAEAKARGQDTTAVEDRLALEMADLEQKYELDKLAASGRLPNLGYNTLAVIANERNMYGKPQLGAIPQSQAWENITDASVDQGVSDFVKKRPWLPDEYIQELERIPSGSNVYELRNSNEFNDVLSHLRDELYNSIRNDSDIPPELKLKPEDLNKMNMDAVVAHVGKVDAWRERNRTAADLLKSRNAATVTHKEYPGTGLEWKELKMPEPDPKSKMDLDFERERSNSLREALEYEGKVMGHCVGSYCPQVASGQKRIFSLRDAKGEPHVTIEVRPGDVGLAMRHLPGERRTALIQQAKKELFGDPQVPLSNLSAADQNELDALISQAYVKEYGEPSPYIIQIKGKSNLKPKDKYIPFVQDFVKSGKWGYISDFENTDLFRFDPKPEFKQALVEAGVEPPEFVTKEQLDALVEWDKSGRLRNEPVPKFADGGAVEKEEYDERAIDEIVEPLRRRLEPFLGEARKVPRRIKQAAADVTEIGPIIKRSNEIPLKYFDISGEMGGEADAMRHLLFQAQLARKYGETPAKIISNVHEYTTLGQPESQREMDLYNDVLGREIAAKAMSDEDLVRLAEKYVKSGRAKVLPKEQRGGY